MSNTQIGQVERIGRSQLLFIHSIDLQSLLDPPSQKKLLEARAEGTTNRLLLGSICRPLSKLGTFSFICDEREQVDVRLRRSVHEYEKSIPTKMFLEKYVPALFEEASGEQLCKTYSLMSVGQSFPLKDILADTDAISIFYDTCQFRIFPDGVFTFRFKFSADGLSVISSALLIAELGRLTRSAVIEKLRRIAAELQQMKIGGLDLTFQSFVDPTIFDVSSPQLLVSHKVLILDAVYAPRGAAISPAELEKEPAVVALLRQTPSAGHYRQQVLQAIGQLNMGYKKDEIYITLRSTTLAVSPGFWDVRSYLSIYVNDLILLIEYFLSRLAFLETVGTAIERIEVSSTSYGNVAATKAAVLQMVALRRLILQMDISLDLDLLVNHYFTRDFISQLVEQRGISNKLNALRGRIKNIDRILDLLVTASFAHVGVGSALGQLRVAIWALIVAILLAVVPLVLQLMTK